MMPRPRPDWAYTCAECGHSWWSSKPPETPPRQCNVCHRRTGIKLVVDPSRVNTREPKEE